MKYGFVLTYEPAEGTIRFLPDGFERVLVYSNDGATFWEESSAEHAGLPNDFKNRVFDKAAEAGKYKLDMAVRAAFPRYRNASPKGGAA